MSEKKIPISGPDDVNIRTHPLTRPRKVKTDTLTNIPPLSLKGFSYVRQTRCFTLMMGCSKKKPNRRIQIMVKIRGII